MRHKGLSSMRKSLERAKTFPDFTVQNAGVDLCRIFTEGVLDIIESESDPAGNPWPPLSGSYAEWKGRYFPGRPMGVLYGIMADPIHVTGIVDVTANVAVVTYGTTDEARQEAEWFQRGRPPGQPPRPFWGFSTKTLKSVRTYLDRRLKKFLK